MCVYMCNSVPVIPSDFTELSSHPGKFIALYTTKPHWNVASLYCRSLHSLHRVQNNAARIVLQAPRRSDVNSLLQTLHWLPVEQRINYKLAVRTFKTQQTSSPHYLNQHISLRNSARNTRSSSVPLLCVPFRRTSFARRSFSTAAPLTWNPLPPAVLNCDSFSTFKSRLKTHLFSNAFC